jgi:serine/threonine protein phosphatase 1
MVGRATYAIGDVHGRLDLVRAALHAIRRHAAGLESRIVFLGDYVDRGPDSRGVIELLMGLQQAGEIVCLKGNHEDMMVRALRERRPEDVRLWLRYGGVETLQSYGVSDIAAAAGSVPDAHLRWMTRLPLTSGDVHRIYVHAGLTPGTAFDEQGQDACLWIRERFLLADARGFERHVVHGHTPTWSGKPEMGVPELLAHRTNLDTGAYATGVMSVGVFPADAPGGPTELIHIRAQTSGMPTVEVAPAAPPTPPAPPSGQPRRAWARLFRR